MSFAFAVNGESTEVTEVCAKEGEFVYDFPDKGPTSCCKDLILNNCVGECTPSILGECVKCRNINDVCTPEDIPCCEGLIEISLSGIDEGTGECVAATCGSICSPCGNGICNSGADENKCNCPEDCDNTAEVKEIPKVLISNEGFQLDEYTLNNMEIKRNILKFDISYSGECKEHFFNAVWDGNFIESLPVQVNIFLSHDSNEDTCEALITKTLEFDLIPIREAYQHTYQTLDKIVINFYDSNNDKYEVIYNPALETETQARVMTQAKIMTQAEIQEVTQEKNKLQIQTQIQECPDSCECTGSVTKCQLQEGREMIVRAGNSGNMIIQSKGVDAETNVELYKLDGEVYGAFKNNQIRNINILPDQVKERIRARINANIEDEIIELDEEGVYQIQVRKRANFLGLFPVRERVRMEINSETGEVIRVRTSWWGFLARDEVEQLVGGCGTVTPGMNDECCQNQGYNSWNQETVECE